MQSTVANLLKTNAGSTQGAWYADLALKLQKHMPGTLDAGLSKKGGKVMLRKSLHLTQQWSIAKAEALNIQTPKPKAHSLEPDDTVVVSISFPLSLYYNPYTTPKKNLVRKPLDPSASPSAAAVTSLVVPGTKFEVDLSSWIHATTKPLSQDIPHRHPAMPASLAYLLAAC